MRNITRPHKFEVHCKAKYDGYPQACQNNYIRDLVLLPQKTPFRQKLVIVISRLTRTVIGEKHARMAWVRRMVYKPKKAIRLSNADIAATGFGYSPFRNPSSTIDINAASFTIARKLSLGAPESDIPGDVSDRK